jgi:5'(3')-deoxyribonucleotidase
MYTDMFIYCKRVSCIQICSYIARGFHVYRYVHILQEVFMYTDMFIYCNRVSCIQICSYIATGCHVYRYVPQNARYCIQLPFSI